MSTIPPETDGPAGTEGPVTEGPVTDRRAERDRERRAKRKARKEAERRLEELREAWLRNHPGEEEEKGRAGRGGGAKGPRA